jgi:hypothetical protein
MARYFVNGEQYSTLPSFIHALHQSGLVNAYKPWTKSEDEELMKLKGELPIYELAKYFKRRKGAIHSRIKKLEVDGVGANDLSNKEYGMFIELLMKGIHPLTGEILSDDSIWRHPTIVNDLKAILKIEKI